MAVPFGFSVGDCLATLHLLKEIGVALRDHGGASADFQATLERFEAIASVLKQLQQLPPLSSSPASPLLNLVDEIHQRAHETEKIAKNFIEKLQKHQATLGRHAPDGFYRGTLSKSKWALAGSKEAKKIYQDIESHSRVISNLFDMVQVTIQHSALQYAEKSVNSLDELKLANSSQFIKLSELNSRFNLATSLMQQQLNGISALQGNQMQNLNVVLQDSERRILDAQQCQMTGLRGDIHHLLTDPRNKSSLTSSVETNLHSELNQIKAAFNSLEQAVAANSAVVQDSMQQVVCHAAHSKQQIGASHDLIFTITEIFKELPLRMRALTEPLRETIKAGAGSKEIPHMTRRRVDCTIDKLFVLLGVMVASLRFILTLYPGILRLMKTWYSIFHTLTPTLQDSILFEDVLGGMHKLDFVYFKHWKMFKAQLETHFEIHNLPGRDKVLLGQYRIMTANNYHRQLAEGNWQTFVHPGSRLIMSIEMKKLRLKDGRCPRTGCIGSPNFRPRSPAICDKCGATYFLDFEVPATGIITRKDNGSMLQAAHASGGMTLQSFQQIIEAAEADQDHEKQGSNIGTISPSDLPMAQSRRLEKFRHSPLTPLPWRTKMSNLVSSRASEASSAKEHQKTLAKIEESGEEPDLARFLRVHLSPNTGPLPENVLTQIFLYLDIRSLMRLQLVCTRWRDILRSSPNICQNLDLSRFNRLVTDDILQSVLSFAGHRPTSININKCFHITSKGFESIANYSAQNLKSLKMRDVWDVAGLDILNVVNVAKNLEELQLDNCRKAGDNLLARVIGWIVPERPPSHSSESTTPDQQLLPPGTIVGCPKLARLSLQFCKHVSDKTMAHIAVHASPRLEEINLRRCTTITDQGFQHWSVHPFPNLTKLCLADCTYLTDSAIVFLSNAAKALRDLDLSFCCALSDTATEVVALGLPLLERVDMSFCGSAVSDSSMRALSLHLRRLRSLAVRGCVRVTGTGVEAILEGCEDLQEFDVSQCKNLSRWIRAGGVQRRGRGVKITTVVGEEFSSVGE